MTPMMLCGHQANATTEGKPCCVICAGDPRAYQVAGAPNLTGRQARCYCGKTVQSVADGTLAFFEFKGEGSREAMERCGHDKCFFFKGVHGEINSFTGRAGITDHEFVPHGAFEFDSFYCGCRGWD